MTSTLTTPRTEAVAAHATGVGIGLLVFMIVWTLGARITPRVWGPPSGALVAMAVALACGFVTAIVSGRRLARTSVVGPAARLDQRG